MKFSAAFLSILAISTSSALPVRSRNGVEQRDIHAGSDAHSHVPSETRAHIHMEKRQLTPDAAVNFLKPIGVPQGMLDLIKVGPPELVQKIISQPPDKLQATIETLKQGKIPAVDGISPKDLMVQFLPGLKVPDFMIELVKGAPDDIIARISTLPIDKLQPIIDEMKQGKIPAVPDVAPKDLIVQFLPGIGVPESTVNLVKSLPDLAVGTILGLQGDQLKSVIGELKQGKIPNIPGLTGGTPTTPDAPADMPAESPAPTQAAPSEAPAPTQAAPVAPIDMPAEMPVQDAPADKPTSTPVAESPAASPAAPAGPVITLPAGALNGVPGGTAYLIAIPIAVASPQGAANQIDG
ncbi:uncharacterized protein DFL_008012 [Arthrobotrys flagrans]|uniref:Uncharacterized protein n=1 Tax=Arthrobotrys flagrans TaxID=97331 RepID=A0A436ZXD9_ARTFL|nr:hypothetical protein DFL_008012 [Arthrobotrys flagrans]